MSTKPPCHVCYLEQIILPRVYQDRLLAGALGEPTVLAFARRSLSLVLRYAPDTLAAPNSERPAPQPALPPVASMTQLKTLHLV